MRPLGMDPPDAFRPPQCEGLEAPLFFQGEAAESGFSRQGTPLARGKSHTSGVIRGFGKKWTDEMNEAEIIHHERKLSLTNVIFQAIDQRAWHFESRSARQIDGRIFIHL